MFNIFYIFVEVVWSSAAETFHSCPIFVLKLILVLSEGHEVEAWKLWRKFFFVWCARFDIRKQIDLKTKEINWLIGKKIPSIYTKQITHLPSGNQTDMELRNRNVGLRQQVHRSHHAEIPILNSQSHNKCSPLCNKSYSTYRLQHHLRKWHHPWKNQ